MKAKTVTSKQFEKVKVLLERIISCKYEVLAEYRHISTVWTVSSLMQYQAAQLTKKGVRAVYLQDVISETIGGHTQWQM